MRRVTYAPKAPEPEDDTPLGRARRRLAEAICRIKTERSREAHEAYDKAKAELRRLEG